MWTARCLSRHICMRRRCYTPPYYWTWIFYAPVSCALCMYSVVVTHGRHTHTHTRINQDRTRRTQTDKQTDRHIPASAVLLTSRGEYQLRIGLGGHVQLDEVRRRICLRLLMSGGNRNLCSYSTTREHTLSIETREAFSVTNCRTNTVLRVCRILCITNRILSL